jgi:hypothetical protein
MKNITVRFCWYLFVANFFLTHTRSRPLQNCGLEWRGDQVIVKFYLQKKFHFSIISWDFCKND